jgi:CysZ protein
MLEPVTSPKAMVASAPPSLARRDGARPGFLSGVGAMFGGFWFVARSPGVWAYAAAPLAIVLVVGGGLGALSVALLPAKIAAWFAATSALGHAGAWVTTVAAVTAALAASALVGVAVAQPLAGPALNAIARRAGAELGAPPAPPTTFTDDVLRGAASIALSAAVGLPIFALLFAVNVAFPPASVVTFPLKLLVVAVLVAWDLCDYPLSLRGLTIAERLRFMRENFAAVVGFGLGLAAISLVPLALLVVLPCGVAGAARLTALADRGGSARPGRDRRRRA